MDRGGQAAVHENKFLASSRVNEGDLVGAAWAESADGAAAVAIGVPRRREDTSAGAAQCIVHPCCWVDLQSTIITFNVWW